jgi:hypothetical protein
MYWCAIFSAALLRILFGAVNLDEIRNIFKVGAMENRQELSLEEQRQQIKEYLVDKKRSLVKEMRALNEVQAIVTHLNAAIEMAENALDRAYASVLGGSLGGI